MDLGTPIFNTEHPFLDSSTPSGEYEMEFQNATVQFFAQIEYDEAYTNVEVEILGINLDDKDGTELKEWDDKAVCSQIKKYC